MAPPRVLVVQHEPGCPPALIGEWLAESGCLLDVRPAWEQPLPSLKGYAGLLVLGGAMDADSHDRHPWLVVARERIVEAADRGVPTLAICLGHQLAFGRTVGLRQVDWEPGVLFDPLVGNIAGEDRALHWNQDVVTRMPEGGEVLASTLDGAVQAARFAPTVWGVQFHPEADHEVVRGWTRSESDFLVSVDMTAAEVLTTIDLAMPELTKTWQPLAAAFAALVRGRAAVTELTDL
jgi:GMP synthase (glutamine-hydrolysing)